MNYPTAPRTDLIDILHGVAVPDPFRRLESADDPATAAWVAEENALTRGLLDSPLRDGLAARLRELHRVPRMSVPSVRGNRIFYTENDGTRAQAVLYVGTGSWGLGAQSANPAAVGQGLETRVLVDPNGLSDDGTTAITVFEPDNAGDRVVYGLSRHGSDVQELLMHDVASGTALADRLEWVKFASIAWHGDGFFYTRYPQPGTVPADQEQYFCQVWYHHVGEAQASDRLVYHRPDAPEVVFEVNVTSDDRHLVIGSYQGASDHAEIHVVRLPPSPPGGFGGTRKPPFDDAQGGPEALEGPDTTETEASEAQPLVTGFDAGWHFIDGRDETLYFRSDAGAPFGRIVRFDLREAGSDAHVVVPESTDTIVDATVAGGRLLVSSLRSASSRLTSWSLDGADERAIALPAIGTINGLGARWTDARSFATFTSFTTPAAIMVCAADALVPIRQTALPFDPREYVTEQVWYPSKDGTPISMFLVSKRGNNGSPACLLTGYGGFNVSLTPSFAPSDFLWLDMGGVLAMANLRGGGEYGDAWHRAGMREQKQRVFDDFVAGAEWLQSTGRAARGRVAIEGASNGGLLVGACLVQRPDLFGAVVCRVPVADMLRYHLFTVGRFWIPEYGCADQAADFPFLLRYSPCHNVIDGTAYPPTLVMTADTDDRVAPGMAKKFAARLQEATAGTAGGPIVLRVETRAGHGAGKPIEKQVDEQADLYAFLFRYLTGTSASEHL